MRNQNLFNGRYFSQTKLYDDRQFFRMENTPRHQRSVLAVIRARLKDRGKLHISRQVPRRFRNLKPRVSTKARPEVTLQLHLTGAMQLSQAERCEVMSARNEPISKLIPFVESHEFSREIEFSDRDVFVRRTATIRTNSKGPRGIASTVILRFGANSAIASSPGKSLDRVDDRRSHTDVFSRSRTQRRHSCTSHTPRE